VGVKGGGLQKGRMLCPVQQWKAGECSRPEEPGRLEDLVSTSQRIAANTTYVLKLRPFCRRSRSCPTKSNPTSRGSHAWIASHWAALLGLRDGKIWSALPQSRRVGEGIAWRRE